MKRAISSRSEKRWSCWDMLLDGGAQRGRQVIEQYPKSPQPPPPQSTTNNSFPKIIIDKFVPIRYECPPPNGDSFLATTFPKAHGCAVRVSPLYNHPRSSPSQFTTANLGTEKVPKRTGLGPGLGHGFTPIKQ